MAEGLISENQLNSWRNEFFYKNLIFNYLSQFCIKSFSFSHCIVKKKEEIFSAKYSSKKFIGKEKCSYSTSEFETWTGSNDFLDITQFLILVLRK